MGTLRPDDLDPAALIASGDWACAHCDPEALSMVALELRDSVGAEEQQALDEVARLTALDMLEASSLWTQVTHRLRERIYGHDAYEDLPPLDDDATRPAPR